MEPSSVNPERLRVPAWQMMLPDESVVKALEPLQVAMVEILAPPPEITRPEARVLVELVLVCKMLPPVIVRPEEESNPPPPTESPFVKVEVAVPWTIRVEVAIRL